MSQPVKNLTLMSQDALIMRSKRNVYKKRLLSTCTDVNTIIQAFDIQGRKGFEGHSMTLFT